MTKQEEKILELIRNNPYIEQAKLAEVLGVKRSTIAVHISNLEKQGYIKGKGYILNDEEYVLGIGAANVDVYGKSRIKIKQHYDHPADISSSVGGVTRNILVNLSKLNVNTKFITAVGDDGYGNTIMHDLKINNIDRSKVLTIKEKTSGVFMQIQDENNDMHLALCDMSILEYISPEYIYSNANMLRNAKLVLIDSSLRLDTLQAILDICENSVPVYIDPISDNYALKIKPFVSRFSCIKPNKTELECLSGIKIKSEKDLYLACEALIKKGVNKIFVSMSKDGILYIDNKNNRISKKFKPITNMANASGAGDASMAAIVYSEVNNLSIEETIDYALAAGISAITCKETINSKLTKELLDKIIKENS